jgi:hypothetical protein
MNLVHVQMCDANVEAARQFGDGPRHPRLEHVDECWPRDTGDDARSTTEVSSAISTQNTEELL